MRHDFGEIQRRIPNLFSLGAKEGVVGVGEPHKVNFPPLFQRARGNPPPEKWSVQGGIQQPKKLHVRHNHGEVLRLRVREGIELTAGHGVTSSYRGFTIIHSLGAEAWGFDLPHLFNFCSGIHHGVVTLTDGITQHGARRHQ